MKIALWWLRRDLRLVDNLALNSALEHASQVAPVFILDPALIGSGYVGEKRTAFLFAGLRELDRSLRQRGSYLILRTGEPGEQLQRLLHECQAQAIFAEPDYSPYASQRDARVSSNLPIHWVGSPAVQPPDSILKNNGQAYTVFTPFSRAWKALPEPQSEMKFSAPERIPTLEGLESLAVPDQPALSIGVPFTAGEVEAQRRLESFTQVSRENLDPWLPPVYRYASGRDRPDLDGTSMLSPYLRFGILSPRQAVVAARQAIRAAPDEDARHSAETWLNELIWREFYIYILYHHPRVRRENFRLPDVRWENNLDHFAAWCTGQTGYPIVDAAMRQLQISGWMHNRARMIVASFLCKDLLIDWRWGERWFMQHLIDGDPAANNGGWQWTAGTGADAAPYFRIFNPVSQGQKHDPQGVYICRWLPELDRVPEAFLHEPWKMPLEVQKAAGCVIGKDYPMPIVDHAERRERVMQAYRNKANDPVGQSARYAG
jgi:deoxyribodipyrimidine photo-lyase